MLWNNNKDEDDSPKTLDDKKHLTIFSLIKTINKNLNLSLIHKENDDIFTHITRGCPHCVMAKAMDCNYRSEFVFQSPYNVHFRANTIGKGINPFILPAMV